MNTSRGWQSPFVRDLANDLRTRLHELECEAENLRQALAILDRTDPAATRELATASASHLSLREALQRRVLAALEETPGLRASVLALSERRDAHELREFLEDLRAQGLVERDGLGWRRPSPVS